MTFSDHVADFRPTHVVPQEGLPAWEAPDVTRPTAPLDAFLPVQLLSRRGEWGQILCANGWTAWSAHSAEALDRYRQAAEDLASGRVDAEAFRGATGGLRAGVVVDGESVWLYDEATGRWMYADGARLVTYRVSTGPGAPAGPEGTDSAAATSAAPAGRESGHAPTRVVSPPDPEAGER